MQWEMLPFHRCQPNKWGGSGKSRNCQKIGGKCEHLAWKPDLGENVMPCLAEYKPFWNNGCIQVHLAKWSYEWCSAQQPGLEERSLAICQWRWFRLDKNTANMHFNRSIIYIVIVWCCLNLFHARPRGTDGEDKCSSMAGSKHVVQIWISALYFLCLAWAKEKRSISQVLPSQTSHRLQFVQGISEVTENKDASASAEYDRTSSLGHTQNSNGLQGLHSQLLDLLGQHLSLKPAIVTAKRHGESQRKLIWQTFWIKNEPSLTTFKMSWN